MRRSTFHTGTAGLLLLTTILPLFFLAFYIPAHTVSAETTAGERELVQRAQQSSGTTSTLQSGATSVASCLPTFLLKQAMGRIYSLLSSTLGLTVPTSDSQSGSIDYGKVLNCIAFALVNTILKKLAADIIDWINSGFEGKPAFLQDFNRFMLGIADSEIGKFIEGSGLAFLCSPFQLQVRLAIARKYSQRGSTPSCTLTGAIGNVQAFLNNFQNGGWSSFLAFTTQPQNNPYGGYILADSSLSLQISGRQSQQIELLRWGRGFLSFTEKYGCGRVGSGDYNENGEEIMVEDCKERIVTPGTAIENSLNNALDTGRQRLLVADEVDEIIEALFAALLNKALQSITGLSKASAYTDDYYRFNPQPISSYNSVTGIRIDPSGPFTVKVESPDVPCDDFDACPDVSRAGRGTRLMFTAFGAPAISATNTAILFSIKRDNSNDPAQAIVSREQRMVPYTWTIPQKGGFPCGIDALCVSGDDLVDGASYRIVADLYTPVNACFGNCPTTPGFQILASSQSLPFTVSTESGVTTNAGDTFTDQLRDDTQTGTGDGIAQQIETVIGIEERVRGIKEQNVFEIENAQSMLLSLESCWKGKQGNVSLDGGQRQTAENNAANARLAASALESQKAPFKSAMTQADQRIAKLRELQSRALNARGVTEADAIMKEFTQLRASGGTSGQVDVNGAEAELQKTKADMAAINQSTNEKLNECSSFPQTPQSSAGFQPSF